MNFDLTPSAVEIAEQVAANASGTAPVSLEEAIAARAAGRLDVDSLIVQMASAEYDELLKDKRGELDTPCYTWDGACHCNHTPTAEVSSRACDNHSNQLHPVTREPMRVEKAHTGPAHTNAEGHAWCPAHQKACGEVHPFVSREQFIRRFAVPQV